MSDSVTEVKEKSQGQQSKSDRGNHLLIAVGAIAGFLSSALGIIRQVFTWQWLRTDAVRTVVLVGIGVAVVIGAYLYLQKKDGKLTKTRLVDMLVGGGIALACIAAAFIFTSRSTGASSSPQLPVLSFAPGQASESLQCHAYQGTGSIPSGYQLEIYISTVEEGGPYQLIGPATITSEPNGWQTPPLKIPADPTWIWPVLVTDTQASSINSIKADNPSAPWSWHAGQLPPSVENIRSLKVSTADLHGAGCEPGWSN